LSGCLVFCRYEGRWFVKAAGWDASDENNKGWFAFDFSSTGMYFKPLCEEHLATMRSLKSFLQVVHNSHNDQASPIEIILQGNTVEKESIIDELVHSTSYFPCRHEHWTVASSLDCMHFVTLPFFLAIFSMGRKKHRTGSFTSCVMAATVRAL
jgi:hypothetical protein